MGASNVNGRPLDPTSRRSPAGEIVNSAEVPGSSSVTSLPDLTDVANTVTPAKGSLLAGDGSVYDELPAGGDGMLITYDAAQPMGLKAISPSAICGWAKAFLLIGGGA